MLPDTPDRVPEHSPRSANIAIEQRTLEQLRRYSSEPALIPARLKTLDEEWDVERTLEMNASTLAFIGTALGWAISPWFPDHPAPCYALSLSARGAGMVPAASDP